ncbi:MAG: oxidoreductase, partial [Gammaproteobacteria bacterium]|nr:oxidoreductase [Gammaproteobacteria bacterium]
MKGLLTPHAIRIVDLYDDGEACRHFTFKPVDPNLQHTARPGQFFNLTVPGHSEAAFTYLSLPDAEGCFDALIRTVGKLTAALFECKKGDLLGFRGPFGNGGWPMAQLHGKRVLFLAVGCGLPPLASAIDTLLADSKSSIALLYGARTAHAQVLKRERAAWGKVMPIIDSVDSGSG